VMSLDVDWRKCERAIDLRSERRFDNLKKGHRSEVQMSVTWKSDMHLRISRQLEAGRRSESYIYNYVFYIATLRINCRFICS
jgi:hypothetical protein